MFKKSTKFFIIFLVSSLFAVSCGGSQPDSNEEGIYEPPSNTPQKPESSSSLNQSGPDNTNSQQDPSVANPQPLEVEQAPTSSNLSQGQPDETLSLGRIVVLGEEFLLADVLAMGVTPTAATATLDGHFTGIVRDTSMIQPLPSTEANYELLASLDPDLIIITQNLANYINIDLLTEIASTEVLTSDDWRQQVIELGQVLDTPQRAEDLLTEYDSVIAESKIDITEGMEVSLATIYSGITIAAWVSGPSNIPQTLLDLGVTLYPNETTYPNVRYGRTYLSIEQLSDFSSPIIVLSQSTAVEGEDQSLIDIEKNLLWKNLPAVKSGKVLTIDRLGYPGVEGRIRLIKDFLAGLKEW
ncbi:MAG: hypothetical protein CL421_02630 [Acidimicrobiaceae bacterium]|nr:hypothetical protein [Acidimicrobiaceae bacterium]|tara:strand:- start:1988 stop:3052 length:1065 start_codon:yes stop_codon:yes gene_type:complete